MTLRCPRCSGAVAAPAAGSEARCPHCGHVWRPAVSSDAYLPLDLGDPPALPLTERHAAPGRASDDRSPTTAAAPAVAIACPVCGTEFAPTPDDEQRCPACATAFQPATGRLRAASGGDPLIGHTLRGCLIDRKLGEGGMGAVYHARQLSLDRSVAIKILPPELARNRSFIQRFEREAKSLARINHPNILQIYDFGEDRRLGLYFMVIEFVDGWDLGEILHRQGRLSQLEAVDIVRQALLGLEQAAEKGVIHRDIKPDNLMIAANGVCKVSDFGLAKALSSGSEVTSIGVRVGTPAFMSPEQCDGAEVDARSDVYNLGCTAFLMLTGRLPYDGETPFSIMLKHKVEPVPSAAALRPELDPRVDALVRRMMAKRPDERCRTLRELIDEAERLLIALAGTASVLRKTHGPVRALAQGARPARHTPPPAAAPRPPPAAAPAASAALPASEVPAWQRLVAELAPLPPPLSVPAVAAEPRPLPAASAQAPAPRPPSARLPAAAPAPLRPGPPPAPADEGSTRTSSRLQAVVERLHARSAAGPSGSSRIGLAERLEAEGDWAGAARAWEEAAELATSEAERGERLARARAARARARRRRWLRGAAVLLAAVMLAVITAWVWTPAVHGMLAARELERLLALPDGDERRARLRAFAAANQGGWRWYRAWFGRGYEVTAAEHAARAAEAEEPPQPPAAAHDRLAELERLADDPRISWAELAQAAAALDHPRAAAIRRAAERALSEAAAARRAIDAARAAGRHGEALELAAAFRTAHARAGILLDGLPLPGRVLARDPDDGRPLAGLRLAVDGVALAGDDGRFCRSATAAVQLEVSAPERAPRRLEVPASADPGELVVEIVLSPAPRWRVPWPSGRPSWLALLPLADAVLVHAPDGLALLLPERGELKALTVPGVRFTPWRQAGADGGWSFATVDGELRQMLPGLERAVPVRRLPAAPLARLERELALQPGVRVAVSVEAAAGGAQLVCRSGERVLWQLPGLVAAAHEPLLADSDEALVVVDDLAMRVVEEDGRPLTTAPLPGPRLGPAARWGGRLLVATAAGLAVVRLAGRGSALEPPSREGGAAVPLVVGERLLLAQSDPPRLSARGVDGNRERELWSQPLAARPQRLGAGDGLVALADAEGRLELRRADDGALLRRLDAGGPLLAAPLPAGGMLVVAEDGGTLAGYRAR